LLLFGNVSTVASRRGRGGPLDARIVSKSSLVYLVRVSVELLRIRHAL
jgi:hypothetical protein